MKLITSSNSNRIKNNIFLLLSYSISILFISFFFYTSAYASTYYISNTGLDTNDGISIDTPWQSIAKVNVSTFLPGDNILFKRGEVWRGASVDIKWSGTEGNPITFGAYGTGDKPIFNGAEVITNWTAVDGRPNVWVTPSPLNDTHDASYSYRTVVAIDSNRFMPVDSLDNLDADLEYFTVDEIGIIDDKVYVYSLTDPSLRNTELSKKIFGISDGLSGTGTHQHITIKDLEFRYYGYAGIDIRGIQTSGNYLIDNCTFYFNRYHGVHIYLGHENNIVQNSNISYCGNGLYSDKANNNSFIGNTITNIIKYIINPGTTDGHAIGIWSSKGVLVEYNYILSGGDFSAVIGVDEADAIIRYNEVHSHSGSVAIGINQILSGDTLDIYYNKLFGEIPAGYCLFTGNVVGSLNLLNNTMVQNGGSVLMNIPYGYNLVIKNNMFYNIGATFRILNITDVGSMVSNHNLWYNKESSATNYVASYTTFAAWQLSHNQDTNSIDGDPMVIVESTNLRLQSSSPAINSGTDVGLTTDILGNPIVGIPDIGAYEFQAPTSPAGLSQYKIDGTTAIASGSSSNENSVVLKFNMSSTNSADLLTPQVEIQELGTPFTNTVTNSGEIVAYSGTPVTGVVTITGLENNKWYHFQVRTNNPAGPSSWVSMGSSQDFGINISHTSSGSSVSSRFNNLISMGNTQAAEELKKEFPNQFPNQASPTINPLAISLSEIQTQTITRTLKIITPRMKGEDVKTLQSYLNTKGYDCGIVDGIFGTKTKNAVVKFQLANQLKGDGIVGPKTKEVIILSI